MHAVAPGNAKITVTAKDGSGVSNECNVTVPDYVVGLKAVTSTHLGWIIASDSYAYKTKDDVPTTALKVAVITYTGTDAGDATYNHGLALAMKDANDGNPAQWCSATGDNCLANQYNTEDAAKGDMAGIANTTTLVGDGHTHAPATAARDFKYDDGVEAGAHPYYTSKWFLPSAGQWEKMINACMGVLGTYNSSGDLIGCFGTRGGTNMRDAYYWSSTESDSNDAYDINFFPGGWSISTKTTFSYVRACLAF